MNLKLARAKSETQKPGRGLKINEMPSGLLHITVDNNK